MVVGLVFVVETIQHKREENRERGKRDVIVIECVRTFWICKRVQFFSASSKHRFGWLFFLLRMLHSTENQKIDSFDLLLFFLLSRRRQFSLYVFFLACQFVRIFIFIGQWNWHSVYRKWQATNIFTWFQRWFERWFLCKECTRYTNDNKKELIQMKCDWEKNISAFNICSQTTHIHTNVSRRARRELSNRIELECCFLDFAFYCFECLCDYV